MYSFFLFSPSSFLFQNRNKQVVYNTISVDDTPWDWIKDLINRMGNEHQPIEDIDGDDFSGRIHLFLKVHACLYSLLLIKMLQHYEDGIGKEETAMTWTNESMQVYSFCLPTINIIHLIFNAGILNPQGSVCIPSLCI